MAGELQEVWLGGWVWWRLAVLFGVILISLVVGRVGRFLLERSAKVAAGEGKEWLSILMRAVARPAVLVSFAVGVWVIVGWHLVSVPPGVENALAVVSHVLNAVAIGYAIYCLVDVIDHRLQSLSSRTESKLDDILAPMVGRSIRITVGVLVVLNVAHVVSGQSMMTILASLGVGGLAIALAGQDTIKNFFGAMVILGDKPFEIGDRVVVDGHDGPVEEVGFRSTKIRTLDGHLVTVPNAQIVSGTVRNIGKRPFIKRVFNVTITYDTSPEKVQRALDILRGILDQHEGMDPEFPPKVYFSDFNDCSLNLLVLYWYHPPEYWDYLAFSERVNMEILRRFNAEGIDFAFPTQTVYLADDVQRRPVMRVLSGEA